MIKLTDLVLTEAKLSAGLVEPLSVAGCSCSVSEFKHKLFMRNIQTWHLLSGTVHLNTWQKSLWLFQLNKMYFVARGNIVWKFLKIRQLFFHSHWCPLLVRYNIVLFILVAQFGLCAKYNTNNILLVNTVYTVYYEIESIIR